MKFKSLTIKIGQGTKEASEWNLDPGDTDSPYLCDLIDRPETILCIKQMSIVIPVSDEGRMLLWRIQHGISTFGKAVTQGTFIGKLDVSMGSQPFYCGTAWYEAPHVKALLSLAGVSSENELEITVNPMTKEAADLMGMLTVAVGEPNEKVVGGDPTQDFDFSLLPLTLEELSESIRTLDLSPRIEKLLMSQGIHFVWMLSASMNRSLFFLKNYGKKTDTDVKERMESKYGAEIGGMRTEHAITLKDKLPWPALSTLTPRGRYRFNAWAKRSGIASIVPSE